MSATTNPINFKNVVKSEKLWRAMDLEPEAINKNDT